jgi:hypothetical protein
VLALVTGVACSEGPTGSGLLQEPGFAADWIGDYQGGGQGSIDGQPATESDAMLHIGFDAEPDRVPSCQGCVTVRLDDSFSMVNVSVQSRTELDLSYRDGVVLYRLRLARSPLGANPNVVLARLTIGNADAPTPIVDMEYVLQRP